MTLNEELNKFTEGVVERRGPAVVAELWAGQIDEARKAQTHRPGLAVGDRAPDFTLPNAVGKPLKLSSLLAEGPVVVAFYRGGWCPYCNMELRALQNVLPEIKSFGARLLAISPETPDNALSTVEKSALEFEVLSDRGNAVADRFGLLYRVSDRGREVMQKIGVDLPRSNADGSWTLPITGTYVIDRNATVRYAYADPDYRIRAEPKDVVAALGTIK